MTEHTQIDYRPLYLKVQKSAALLWANVPKDGQPYIGAFSGGKDSVVIKELARLTGVPVEWHYHQTTIDPPELIYFIRKFHPDVIWDKPRYGNLFHRVVEKGYIPSRTARWCCSEYKEKTFPGKTMLLGIRIAEGVRRKGRWTQCLMQRPDRKMSFLLPIRLWPDHAVWEFIRTRGIPYCSLYDEGFKRLGCVGCPLVTHKQRQQEFERWPMYERAWKRAFERVWASRAGTFDAKGKEWWGSRTCDTWQELFDWWHNGQISITKWRVDQGLRIKSRVDEPFQLTT